MKDKTIDCLKLCSMPFSAERGEFEKEICEKYSRKVVARKLNELVRRGYIDHGMSIFGAWLTDEGRAFVKNLF
jgi:hypothetical protein